MPSTKPTAAAGLLAGLLLLAPVAAAEATTTHTLHSRQTVTVTTQAGAGQTWIAGPRPLVRGSSGFSLMGCYAAPASHVFSPSTGGFMRPGGLTVEACLAACAARGPADAPYAAIIDGKACACGRNLASSARAVADARCSKPCAGDDAHYCGTADYAVLYARNPHMRSTMATRTPGSALAAPTRASHASSSSSSRQALQTGIIDLSSASRLGSLANTDDATQGEAGAGSAKQWPNRRRPSGTAVVLLTLFSLLVFLPMLALLAFTHARRIAHLRGCRPDEPPRQPFRAAVPSSQAFREHLRGEPGSWQQRGLRRVSAMAGGVGSSLSRTGSNASSLASSIVGRAKGAMRGGGNKKAKKVLGIAGGEAEMRRVSRIAARREERATAAAAAAMAVASGDVAPPRPARPAAPLRESFMDAFAADAVGLGGAVGVPRTTAEPTPALTRPHHKPSKSQTYLPQQLGLNGIEADDWWREYSEPTSPKALAAPPDLRLRTRDLARPVAPPPISGLPALPTEKVLPPPPARTNENQLPTLLPATVYRPVEILTSERDGRSGQKRQEENKTHVVGDASGDEDGDDEDPFQDAEELPVREAQTLRPPKSAQRTLAAAQSPPSEELPELSAKTFQPATMTRLPPGSALQAPADAAPSQEEPGADSEAGQSRAKARAAGECQVTGAPTPAGRPAQAPLHADSDSAVFFKPNFERSSGGGRFSEMSVWSAEGEDDGWGREGSHDTAAMPDEGKARAEERAEKKAQGLVVG